MTTKMIKNTMVTLKGDRTKQSSRAGRLGTLEGIKKKKKKKKKKKEKTTPVAKKGEHLVHSAQRASVEDIHFLNAPHK